MLDLITHGEMRDVATIQRSSREGVSFRSTSIVLLPLLLISRPVFEDIPQIHRPIQFLLQGLD